MVNSPSFITTIYYITSFILLLNLSCHKHEFFNHYNLFQSLQSFSITRSFSIITIFLNYQNLFWLSWPFSIIMTFFNYRDLLYYNFFYHNFIYLYENKPTYDFHHLTLISCRQNMTKMFCQFLLFPIYTFYCEFFSFCV